MSFVIVTNKIKTVKINNKSSAVSYGCENVELGGKE
jgi:hypothetical protein